MGFLDRLKKNGATSLLQGVEYSAASFGLGYVKNRWRDKAHVAGVPVDLAAGGVLKLLAVGLELTNKGGGLVPHIDVVGNASLGSFFHTLGSSYGAAHSGLRRLLIPASDLAKAKAALPNATILGDIPKAPPGDYLSSRDLAAMARG